MTSKKCDIVWIVVPEPNSSCIKWPIALGMRRIIKCYRTVTVICLDTHHCIYSLYDMKVDNLKQEYLV